MAAIAPQHGANWIKRIARIVADPMGRFLLGMGYVITGRAIVPPGFAVTKRDVAMTNPPSVCVAAEQLRDPVNRAAIKNETGCGPGTRDPQCP